MVKKKKGHNKDDLRKKNDILKEYMEKLNHEVILYRNELRRAMERYRETKEPIFKLNSVTVNLADIIGIIEKVMFSEKTISENFWVRPVSASQLFKDTVQSTEHYLQNLPGAKERVPRRPEIVNQWMKEK